MPSLKYPPEHARPLGYFYYGALFRTAGFAYPAWIAVLQLIHMLNVVLLWLLLRKLRFEGWAVAVACLFFAMHRALSTPGGNPCSFTMCSARLRARERAGLRVSTLGAELCRILARVAYQGDGAVGTRDTGVL